METSSECMVHNDIGLSAVAAVHEMLELEVTLKKDDYVGLVSNSACR